MNYCEMVKKSLFPEAGAYSYVEPDVYVSWAETYPQEHLLNHDTVFQNLTINHIIFLSPLHPFIPFLTLSSDTATQQYTIADN